MYTGIVTHTSAVSSLENKPGLTRLTLEFEPELMDGLELGASVSVDGVCLTVADINSNQVSFDAMAETLDRTTLKYLSPASKLNIERSAKYGVEIGGHPLSGHIDGTAKIVEIKQPESNYIMYFKVSSKLIDYIFEKGFIGVHGASLTVAGIDYQKQVFWVYLIPETLKRTNLSLLETGDEVNIEIDRQTQVVVDTITRCMQKFQLSSHLPNSACKS